MSPSCLIYHACFSTEEQAEGCVSPKPECLLTFFTSVGCRSETKYSKSLLFTSIAMIYTKLNKDLMFTLDIAKPVILLGARDVATLTQVSVKVSIPLMKRFKGVRPWHLSNMSTVNSNIPLAKWKICWKYHLIRQISACTFLSPFVRERGLIATQIIACWYPVSLQLQPLKPFRMGICESLFRASLFFHPNLYMDCDQIQMCRF